MTCCQDCDEERYGRALERIIQELGVPDDTYPAPVALAVAIAQHAVRPDLYDAPEEGKLS